MYKIIGFLIFTLAGSVPALAHQAFMLLGSTQKTVLQKDIDAAESLRTPGRSEGSQLSFTESEIRLVVTTGPADDMLSYRIQGMRNPTLIVPANAKLTILFINSDVDMRHDIRFGHVMGEFVLTPDTGETAGSDRLPPTVDDGPMQAVEMVIQANGEGMYKYFCSVRGHAKGGMWGNIAVGVKPGEDIKSPAKQKHVHTPDENKIDEMPPQKKVDTVPDDKPGMDMNEEMGGDHSEHKMKMSSTANIGDPMERESSGTSWVPDNTPVYAWMKMYRDGGMLMLMGTAYLRYTAIGSDREVSVAGKGSRQRFDAPSMMMLMYSRPINERSQFGVRVMASLDPLIERGYGYPLLYQSGELYRGEPIHDRQHPHDLIAELAATYSYKFDDQRSFYIYAGYPGEPALGPPTFMHRPSAANNPDAPIGHHWQDATHITYGVVTGGFSFGKVKIEASAFNGREPDSDRWRFDAFRLDSFSGRLSFNPTKNLALQISHGYLRNPERSEPDVRILRKTTASAIYNRNLGEDRSWATSVVWGQNYANGERSNSFLVESNLELDKNAIFGRFESVQKSGHELVLDDELHHDLFWVNSYSAGYVRDLIKDKGVDVGIGGMLTFGSNPASLSTVYGGTVHTGWQMFLRIRPSKIK